MSLPIEDYALIGDCETAALISRYGSIDWMCVPRFDSGACFASLLGNEHNGRWLIAPADRITSVSRRYRPGTLILETDYETQSGSVRVIDFMPVREEHAEVIRIVQGLDKKLVMKTELVIRFDYGVYEPWIINNDNGILAIAGPDLIRLGTPVALRFEDRKLSAQFTVSRGERIGFLLDYQRSHERLSQVPDAADMLHKTAAFWKK